MTKEHKRFSLPKVQQFRMAALREQEISKQTHIYTHLKMLINIKLFLFYI